MYDWLKEAHEDFPKVNGFPTGTTFRKNPQPAIIRSSRRFHTNAGTG